MATQWFKFFGGEFLSDPKMLALSALERACWVTLLCYASLSEGVIEYLTEEKLMMQAGIAPNTDEWKRVTGVSQKFKTMRMIEIKGEIIEIVNWKKRQDSFLTGAERTAKYRAKIKKDVKSHPRHERDAEVTLEQNRIEENRKEKKKSKSAASAAPAPSPSKKAPEDPLTLDGYLKWMRESPHRHVRLIGEYADEIKPDCSTRGQWEVFTRRNLRAAKALSPFTDKQIETAMTKLGKDVLGPRNPKGFITTWSLETLLKYITK